MGPLGAEGKPRKQPGPLEGAGRNAQKAKDRNRQDAREKALLAMKLGKQYSLTNKQRNASNGERPFFLPIQMTKIVLMMTPNVSKAVRKQVSTLKIHGGSVNYYRLSVGGTSVKKRKVFLFSDLIISLLSKTLS